ncbi:hypothetical protein ACTRXD_14160 [Nitrospira sp. T9]|uniref:hypothetical protein n=1 Tax=unclassified Nitrospira TaxID=2652172 RepID=UPI003F97CC6F
MKTLSPSTNGVINNPEEFKQFIPANFSYFLERSSGLIRRILQDMGQWADNSAHEKLLLRLSFDLVERFIEYCPSQLPCRPSLLLDGFISDFFGRPQESKASSTSNPVLYRYLDGLLNRAVLSRDALICLFYHFYGMKPVEVGFFLGLEEGQTQRIYKNFARWRQRGWFQAADEVGLTTQEVQSLVENQASNPESFHLQVRDNLETLLPFYRKSDPPYYPCLEDAKWQEMFREGYGFDYRMWHLPLCLSCMKVITEVGDSFLLNPDVTLNFHVSPHSLREEEVFWPTQKNFHAEKKRHTFNRNLQMA